MNRRVFLGLATALLCLVVVTGADDCFLFTSGYTQFKTDNSLCHFTFEYPRRYQRTGGKIDNKYPTIFSVDFDLPTHELPMSVPGAGKQNVRYVPGHMEVLIYDANFRNATALGEIEGDLAAAARDDGYRLLDRATTTVAGIQAETAYYTNNTLMIFSVPKYFWEVRFEHDGLIWCLSAYSEASLIETVKADFEHLVSTFQTLDIT
jgi:hypothetical protein